MPWTRGVSWPIAGAQCAFKTSTALLEMCSPALRTHLRMREHLNPDLPAMRQEISDWLFEELPRKKADKALGAITDNEEQETKEEEWEEAHVWSDEHGGWI